ncbi:hypothetical protein QCA50_006745 [Cerrena zonata]|uniref:Uncharacterized protein n=1 Tax=Cerrena zonata TaxID=2478898 RepID=A0AAW0GKC8_9APHY
MRSFFLRRRLRQRIDEAMAAGMWPLPDAGPGSRRRGFGEKPQLWDASLGGTGDGGWEKFKPVSVRLISYETNASPPPAPQPKTALFQMINPFSHMRSWRRSRSASTSSSLTSPDSAPALLELPASSSTVLVDDTIQSASEVEVSVIIAMPDPHRPSNGLSPAEFVSGKGKERLSSADSYWSEHEEGVPDVVLGACRVSLKSTDSDSMRP